MQKQQKQQKDTFWLYDQIKNEKPDWDPRFAMPASVNWMKALSIEILSEHGTSIKEQLLSCNRHFLSKQVRSRGVFTSLSQPYGTLFHSLTFVVALTSLCDRKVTNTWMFPSAIVMYYYATYNAMLSMLNALCDYNGENHSTAIKTYNELYKFLPHPFNMIAEHKSGEKYEASLPNFPNNKSSNLQSKIDNTREQARGMIIEYLNGTAKWNVENIKDRIKQKNKIDNFKNKVNQEIRDKSLPHNINYLNCAFRYRGKANYRDSIFLPYGKKHNWLSADYVESLQVVSSFTFTCAVAYIEQRFGKKYLKEFWNDINLHFRDKDLATSQELFWQEFVNIYSL